MVVFVGVQIATVAFGAAVAAFSGTIAFRRRSHSAAYFSAFAAGAMLNHIASIIIWVHDIVSARSMAGESIGVRFVPWIFMAGGLILLVSSPPRFSHSVAGICPNLFFRLLQRFEIAAAAVGATLLLIIPSRTTLVSIMLLALLLEILIRSSAYLLIRGTPGLEPVSRRLSLITVAASALFPVLYAVSAAGSLNFTGEATSNIFAFFFTLGMTLMTVVVVRSFDHPPFLAAGELTDYFITKFALSRRETEIVEFILRDADNKTIAASMHISIRTVENHLHSVYGKTGVGTRGELARLVRSSM